MAYINIPTKDNTTPLTPAEFNYLVDKLNARRLRDLIDVQDSDAASGDILIHNGSGWVLTPSTDIGGGGGTPPPVTTEFDYIDFNTTLSSPTYLDGRLFYDKTNKTLAFYNDEASTLLQIGEEQRIRVFNPNAFSIINGQAVSVTGITLDHVVEVGLAISSDKTSAINTIGIATHDIEAGTYGWACTSGVVRDVNTEAYTAGDAIWLSSTVAGAYQNFRPQSPNYEVRMGGVIYSDSVLGKLYAELRIIDNDHDNSRFLNGAILEGHNVTMTHTPTVTTLNLNEVGSNGYLSAIFNQEYTKITTPASIVLTNGTDIAPQKNYIYINNLGVITKSLTGFPTAEQYAPVATLMVQSAASANTYGCYKVHAWTDHLANSVGQGHLSHINKWIRNRPALWKSGVVLTPSLIGTSATTINLAWSSGVVYQLHEHNFPAFNTASGNGLYGINNPITPYARRTGLTSAIDTDSTGASIGNNKYYKLVFWGVVSEETGDCKIMFNLPNGSYTNEADALSDITKTANYTIPEDYIGTGFLISAMVIQRTTTTVKIITNSIEDLRGLFPASGSGGGVIGGAGITRWTELSDTPISITANQIVVGNSGGTALEMIAKGTAFNKNFSTVVTDIKMNGTQSLGTLSTMAKADHIHPTDTTRLSTSGTAANSNLLDSLDSTKFLRSDVADEKTSGALTFNDSVDLKFSTAATQVAIGSTFYTLLYGDYKIRDGGSDRFTFGRTTGNLTLNGSAPLFSITDAVGSFQLTTNTGGEGIIKTTGASKNIRFFNDSAETMRINGSGNVSIGNFNNIYNLDVSGTGRFTSDVNFENVTFWRVNGSNAASQRCDNRTEATTLSRLHWYGLTSAGGTSNFRHAYYDGSTYINATAESGGLTIAGILRFNSTLLGNSKVAIETGDSWLRFNGSNAFTNGIYCGTGVLRTDGNFQVGASGSKFNVTSAGVVTAVGNMYAPDFRVSSDRRLKTNISNVDKNDFIDVQWKTFEFNKEKGKKRYGVIAQELEETHPEFVHTDDKGMKSVSYTDLLIAKIAELEERLTKLEK